LSGKKVDLRGSTKLFRNLTTDSDSATQNSLVTDKIPNETFSISAISEISAITHNYLNNFLQKYQTASVEFPSPRMPHLAIIFTIFLLLFHPTIPQMKTYFKMEKIICNFSMEYYFENASCRALPIDRDTVLISFYGMTRKPFNDLSVMDLKQSIMEFS
jgi:hypothetical protein